MTSLFAYAKGLAATLESLPYTLACFIYLETPVSLIIHIGFLEAMYLKNRESIR